MHKMNNRAMNPGLLISSGVEWAGEKALYSMPVAHKQQELKQRCINGKWGQNCEEKKPTFNLKV